MQRHHTWFRPLMLLSLLVFVPMATAQQPRAGGILRIAWEQDVTGFDPHWSIGLQVADIVGNLFHSLVTSTTRCTMCRN